MGGMDVGEDQALSKFVKTFHETIYTRLCDISPIDCM
jgi:hypothetical protein